MKTNFTTKTNWDLISDVGNLRHGMLLNFLLSQPQIGDKLKTQTWKQTYLAKLLICHPNSIQTDLNKLQDDGWLKYKRANYKQLTTTEIELTDKTLSYLIGVAEPKKKKVYTNKHNTPPNENILNSEINELTENDIIEYYSDNNFNKK